MIEELREIAENLKEANAIAEEMSKNMRANLGIDENAFESFVSKLMNANSSGSNEGAT